MDAPREEHAAQCASANSDTPNVCEAAEEEGVYGPWMVVKRRFSGRKGTKPSPSTYLSVIRRHTYLQETRNAWAHLLVVQFSLKALHV